MHAEHISEMNGMKKCRTPLKYVLGMCDTNSLGRHSHTYVFIRLIELLRCYWTRTLLLSADYVIR